MENFRQLMEIVGTGIDGIRTFLSLSLEVELEGRWPWQTPRHS